MAGGELHCVPLMLFSVLRITETVRFDLFLGGSSGVRWDAKRAHVVGGSWRAK